MLYSSQKFIMLSIEEVKLKEKLSIKITPTYLKKIVFLIQDH